MLRLVLLGMAIVILALAGATGFLAYDRFSEDDDLGQRVTALENKIDRPSTTWASRSEVRTLSDEVTRLKGDQVGSLQLLCIVIRYIGARETGEILSEQASADMVARCQAVQSFEDLREIFGTWFGIP